ncbi:MAG: DUF6065 family protein [Pseudomonadota bacterium]|jgi:hypothetical protein
MVTTASFRSLLPLSPEIRRADTTIEGSVPLRAFRYCEPFVQASGYGWTIPCPLDFRIVWQGGRSFDWRPESYSRWSQLTVAQLPGYSDWFQKNVPASFKHLQVPFLTALPELGVVQIWSGYVVRLRRRWSLLVRGPVNRPPKPEFYTLEGLVEFDWWCGPLFGNIQFLKTDVEVKFQYGSPLLHASPVPRIAYTDGAHRKIDTQNIAEMTKQDWDDLSRALFFGEKEKPLGAYASAARRRRTK